MISDGNELKLRNLITSRGRIPNFPCLSLFLLFFLQPNGVCSIVLWYFAVPSRLVSFA